jgi:hypothetical protein
MRTILNFEGRLSVVSIIFTSLNLSEAELAPMIPAPANNGKPKLIQRRGAEMQRNAEMKERIFTEGNQGNQDFAEPGKTSPFSSPAAAFHSPSPKSETPDPNTPVFPPAPDG